MKKKLLLLVSFALSITAWAQDSAYDQLNFVDGVCQIATTEDLTHFAQAVNEGNNQINAVLTADVDYPEAVMIGTDAIYYGGTFDGQWHTINYTLNVTEKGAGLFRSLSGTVQNLVVKGTLNTSSNLAGGIVGWLYAGKILNCVSEVNIVSTLSGDAAYAGIASRASAAGCVIDHCIYTGTISGEAVANCAGILGWAGDNCTATVSNCAYTGQINIGEDTGDNVSYTISRREGTAPCTNCYYVNENKNANTGTTQVTEEDVKSGMLCYLLNGCITSDITWSQNLAEDAFPYPNADHGTVYPVGNLRCDGQPADGETLSFSNTGGSERPAHNYVDGICTVCGQTDPSSADMVDGFYQIGTADQFIWFATKVNQGENEICAQLTGDFTLSGDFAGIGSTSNHYKGTIDGQNHTLTIDLTVPSSSWGVVRYLEGTIKNLHIDGTLASPYNKVGPLVGESFAGTVQNVWSSVSIISSQGGDAAISGLIGRGSSDGTLVENCLFTGTITGDSYNSAAFIGWSGSTSTIRNCLFSGSIEVDASQGNPYVMARNPGNVTCENDYYVNLYGTANDNTTQVTVDDVLSGKVCYLLNGDQSNLQWSQSIGSDDQPIPAMTQDVVYGLLGVYGNAGDSSSFSSYRNDVINAQEEYCSDVLAQKSLVENYLDEVKNLINCSNIADMQAAVEALLPDYEAVKTSQTAYEAYQAKVEEVKAYLEEHDDFANEKRDELETYLTENEEPSDLYANGTALYIMEERQLTTDEIQNETKKVDAMLEEAILFAPTSGTNITKLLVNPTFAEGWNGWEGVTGTSYGTSPTSTMPAAECWNSTMDMYQTLTGLENGIYEMQVNGAFRPYPADDYSSTNYAAFLTANDVKNYFQANIEGIITPADAVDGYNCNITGDNPDYAVQDIEGNIIGYTMHGIVSACNAFQADRYQNSVLCQVTDGTLKLGISVPGTGQQPDWLGFGNVQLIYHGQMDEATDGLDNVLESMSARATTILTNYESSFGEDYASYPNFAQSIKDELQAAINAVETTSDNAAKYALIQKFSDLFQQVYDCKKAYINLMSQVVKISDLAVEYAPVLTDDQVEKLNTVLDAVSTAYMDGTFSQEQASHDYTSDLFDTKIENGVFHIASPLDYMVFHTMVNDGKNGTNAVLDADIDLSAVEDPSVANSSLYYAGTFDGQGHTINLNMTATGSSYGLFQFLSGTVKNLRLTGTLNTAYNKVGPLVGELESATVRNVLSEVNVISTQGGDGAISGLAGRASLNGSIIQDCAFTGTITGDSYNSAALVGYAGATVTLNNCLFSGSIDVDATQGNPYVISRNAGNATCTNVYYVNAYGTENTGATQITAEQLASGEICWLLNGKQKDIQWTQTIGQDQQPVPFTTQSTVYINGDLLCDGITLVEGSTATYSNTPATNIPEHNYVDGMCTVCGEPDPTCAELVDGYYQLGTVDQMKWFITRVNQGDNTLNAQMTADIDMTGVEFEAIGTTTNHYKGILDGQYHKLTIDMTATASSYGFIRYMEGTVKNLHLDGVMNTAYNKVGALVGESFAGTFQNVWSSVNVISSFTGDGAISGFIGRGSADGTLVENCLYSGTISGTSYNSASFIGYSGSKSTLRNCLFSGNIEVDATQGNPYVISRNPDNTTCENVYYVNLYGTANVGATQITAEQVANGEALALLGSGWSQEGDLCIPVPAPVEPTGFQYYMLEISALQNNNNCIQISEFDLLTEGGTVAGLKVYGSQSAESNNNEGIDNLCDDDVTTKWCGNFSRTAYIFLNAGEAVAPVAYRMTTANDNAQYSNRSPMTWKLYGSNTAEKAASAESWTLIDARTNDYTMQNVNYTPFDFQITYDWTTGLNDITVDEPTKAVQGIYNILGQKVQQMHRGLYIINGHKVLVK